MEQTIILTPEMIEDFLHGKDVKGYEGWSIDTDPSTGSFDSGKGAMIDYTITLYNSDGDPIYEAIGGYYNGQGHTFDYDLEFELIPETSEPELLVKTVVWYGGKDNGDGSNSIHWFLTEEETYKFDNEGEGCECTGSVETYIGSDIHEEALENSNNSN